MFAKQFEAEKKLVFALHSTDHDLVEGKTMQIQLKAKWQRVHKSCDTHFLYTVVHSKTETQHSKHTFSGKLASSLGVPFKQKFLL